MIQRTEDGRSGKEFVHCIAQAVREKCAVVLGSGSFMSILSDGSQARKTGKEKELVLIRTERNGVPVYLVASLLEVSRFGGGDAKSIVAGINSVFQKDGTPLWMDKDTYSKKVISCTADGASVNFGKYNGVLTQLKENRPWLLTIHCVNHRVELAVKEAFNISQLNNVDEFYKTNFYLLRNSGKLKSEVAESAKVLGINYYTISKIHGTRFVGHRRKGFQNLLESWPAYITAYENFIANDKGSNAKTKAKVSGLLKKFKSYVDVLESIVPASKIFEANELLPYEINSTILKTTLEMEQSLEEIGDDLEFVDSYVHRFKVSTKEGAQSWLSGKLEGDFIRAGDKRKKEQNRSYVTVPFEMSVINEDRALETARILKRKLYTSLIKTLKSRFKDYSSEKDIYHCMRFIDMEYWQKDKDFGNNDISSLSKHFTIPLNNAGYNDLRVLTEWKKFKIHAITHFSEMPVRDMWKSVLTYKRESYPNLSILVSLILSISGSNSSVERCFSLVTSILSDRRLTMSHDTLEDSVIILGNDSLWSKQERVGIIERAREIYMSKRRRTKLSEKDQCNTTVTMEKPDDVDVVNSDYQTDSEDDMVADEMAEVDFKDDDGHLSNDDGQLSDDEGQLSNNGEDEISNSSDESD